MGAHHLIDSRIVEHNLTDLDPSCHAGSSRSTLQATWLHGSSIQRTMAVAFSYVIFDKPMSTPKIYKQDTHYHRPERVDDLIHSGNSSAISIQLQFH